MCDDYIALRIMFIVSFYIWYTLLLYSTYCVFNFNLFHALHVVWFMVFIMRATNYILHCKYYKCIRYVWCMCCIFVFLSSCFRCSLFTLFFLAFFFFLYFYVLGYVAPEILEGKKYGKINKFDAVSDLHWNRWICSNCRVYYYAIKYTLDHFLLNVYISISYALFAYT